MHSPAKVKPKGLSDHLAAMSRAVMEPGLNWRVVDSKWPGIVEAFDCFDVRRVASYSPADIGRLMEDRRVIRNRRKIEAIVHNAGEMLALDGVGGDFAAYLHSKPTYELLVEDLKSRFEFLGDSGAYHFLYSVGEQVPSWEDWMGTHPRSHAAARAHHS